MRSVYFVEQKQKSLLQRQLKKEKIIFKAVVNCVRHAVVRYIVVVRTLNKKYTRVEV